MTWTFPVMQTVSDSLLALHSNILKDNLHLYPSKRLQSSVQCPTDPPTEKPQSLFKTGRTDQHQATPPSAPRQAALLEARSTTTVRQWTMLHRALVRPSPEVAVGTTRATTGTAVHVSTTPHTYTYRSKAQ